MRAKKIFFTIFTMLILFLGVFYIIYVKISLHVTVPLITNPSNFPILLLVIQLSDYFLDILNIPAGGVVGMLEIFRFELASIVYTYSINQAKLWVSLAKIFYTCIIYFYLPFLRLDRLDSDICPSDICPGNFHVRTIFFFEILFLQTNNDRNYFCINETFCFFYCVWYSSVPSCFYQWHARGGYANLVKVCFTCFGFSWLS